MVQARGWISMMEFNPATLLAPFDKITVLKG
jgi:hypothetical protein